MSEKTVHDLRTALQHAKTASMGDLRGAVTHFMEVTLELFSTHERKIRTLQGRFNDIAGL